MTLSIFIIDTIKIKFYYYNQNKEGFKKKAI